MHKNHAYFKKYSSISTVSQKSGFYKLKDLNHRDVFFKRNLFVYAKFLQWFSRHMSAFSDFYRSRSTMLAQGCTSSQMLSNLHAKRRRRQLCFLFITSKNTSFLRSLASGLTATTTLHGFHLQWNPLFFFYAYAKIRESIPEFFPLLFIDPLLLKDPIFYRNALLSFFGKYPIFLVGGLKEFVAAKYIHEMVFFKQVYPLIVSAGYGIYWFLFWLRFLLKVF